MFNQLKAAVNTKLDKWFPPLPQAAPAAPRRRQSVPRPQKAPRRPAAAPSVTYEQWKAGKLGRSEKVTAPRGKGQEWANRYFCEMAIERANYWEGCHRTTKQYHTGSHNDRKRQTAYKDRKAAWNMAMAPAKAMLMQPIPEWADTGGWWKTQKEVVQECLEYAHELLEMVR